MVNYYNLKKIDVSSKDGYIDSNDEHFGEKLYAGLMSRNIVEWRIDFTLDDPDVWYHYGATISKILKNQYGISGVDKPTRAIKDGLEYCIADFDYYLKNATQDQVDISQFSFGQLKGPFTHKPYNWAKCVILWKDDFFRIGNPEIMDMETMLGHYLCIFATGFQKGVGIIDGYSISDYQSFLYVASSSQIEAVNAEIERRRQGPSIWSQLWVTRLKNNVKGFIRGYN